ncbi:MAG: Grx4 family monothiol glutaredoxin [Deltaproteobacteria bacterium]|jgi:monothiol glutaredoxin
MNEATKQRISETIAANPVVLFMKGRRRLPQCGFSAQVVGLLDQVIDDYQTVNVLDDPEIRQGIKEFSDWPTIPQLYINGEFVGGCDIVTQMFEAGDLHKALGKEQPKVEAPTLTVSDTAAAALKGALQENGAQAVRLIVDAAWRPGLDLVSPGPGDMKVEANGVLFVVDAGTAQRANGVSIDFVDGDSGGFKIENPNEPARVKPLHAKELALKMQNGDAFELIDVRTPQEAEVAKIEGAKLLDDGVKNYIEGLDKDTVLVFHCHHGPRAQNAASYFLNQGFKKVYNLVGGIDAWSQQVDNTVPRY